MSTYLASMEWVNGQLRNPEVRIIDCRFIMGQLTAGKEAYKAEHIPGAYYFDLEEDMSGTIKEHGGRHPLPDAEDFAQKLGLAGVDENVTVVSYDDQGGAMASRFWWLLQYFGHSKAYVMNGGFSQWKANGYEVTPELPAACPRIFKPAIQQQLVASMEEVKGKIGKEGIVLIDSRETKRYLGLEEPIDFKAGHIPSAVNHFWKDSLNDQGTWKSGKEQRERFKGIQDSDEILVYCGSGVTACPNFLALKEAGYKNVRLYSGSWSDWISYPDNPIAAGRETE
ncbi:MULTISPECIES: sulfurtransferase [unclassified Paenibacillus]|uniref:sulfurtransferase n=1 Tax=unclassified Paenibacillus TaxID=185978 RepID=UPI0006D2234E|nr:MULTISPECIES: sulfurtransferase [unclassified Paenibacillus]